MHKLELPVEIYYISKYDNNTEDEKPMQENATTENVVESNTVVVTKKARTLDNVNLRQNPDITRKYLMYN